MARLSFNCGYCFRWTTAKSKSVINMVHRIQNRNPGYSDFSAMNSSLSSNFKNNIQTIFQMEQQL